MDLVDLGGFSGFNDLGLEVDLVVDLMVLGMDLLI